MNARVGLNDQNQSFARTGEKAGECGGSTAETKNGAGAPLFVRYDVSMRHQDRNCHRFQHGAGDAAEQNFTEARMAVAAHDDHVGTEVCGN